MVTNMPFWAERVGVPRALAVEFPFGHILGRAHDREMQRRVLRQALDVLKSASGPGTILHFQERWPEPPVLARLASEPDPLPPIAGQMGRHIGKLLRGMRRG